MSSEVKLIDDDLWDHYSGLPSPLWYQHITEIEDDGENTSSSNITTAATE
jgi:hypothetical protein